MRASLLFVALFILAANSPLAAQSSSASEPEIEIEIRSGNSLVRQSGGLVVAAAETVNAGADLALDAILHSSRDPGISPAIVRLGRLWFVNLPVASLAHGFAHDYGHFARLDEAGIHTRRRRITDWPWPVPITIGVEEAGGSRYPDPSDLLGIFGGGEQGSAALRQSMVDKIYSRDTANYFDWVIVGYAALDFTAYNIVDLGLTSHSARYFFGGAGDFGQYVETLARLDPAGFSQQTEARRASSLRHDAWLNLIDYSLVAAVRQVGAYVVTGERRTTNPALTFGRWRLVPGMHAVLTSLGPERGVDVRLLTSRYLSHLDVRRVTTPSDQQLWGAGFQLRSRDTARLQPEGRADVWQRPDGGSGGRIEIGARRTVPGTRRRLEGSLLVGYKTNGYLVDAPVRSGVLLSVSATVH